MTSANEPNPMTSATEPNPMTSANDQKTEGVEP